MDCFSCKMLIHFCIHCFLNDCKASRPWGSKTVKNHDAPFTMLYNCDEILLLLCSIFFHQDIALCISALFSHLSIEHFPRSIMKHHFGLWKVKMGHSVCCYLQVLSHLFQDCLLCLWVILTGCPLLGIVVKYFFSIVDNLSTVDCCTPMSCLQLFCSLCQRHAFYKVFSELFTSRHGSH